MNKITLLIKSNKNPYRAIDNVRSRTCLFEEWKNIDGKTLDNPLIKDEFKILLEKHVKNAIDIFDMQLSSLANQKYKKFEIVFVHSRPEEVNIEVLEKYKDKLDIKLIKPKWTPWRDIGVGYSDYVSNVNSGIIWSNGEIIQSIQDSSLYPNNYTEELSKLHKFGFCGIPPRYIYGMTASEGEMNDTTNSYKIIGSKNSNIYRKDEYPSRNYYSPACYWGYALSFFKSDAIKVNGFDETLDGVLGADDGDFYKRVLKQTKKVNLIMSKTPIYGMRQFKEVGRTKKWSSNKLMVHLNQRPYPKMYTIANTQRPKIEDILSFKSKYNVIDDNIKCISDVPTFNLKELIDRRGNNPKETGEIIWSS